MNLILFISLRMRISDIATISSLYQKSNKINVMLYNIYLPNFRTINLKQINISTYTFRFLLFKTLFFLSKTPNQQMHNCVKFIN